MFPEPSKLLETFELSARPIGPQDVGLLHELSISVGWPHRPDDWALLLSLGRGVVACDEIGRVVGTGMWFPMDGSVAAIGMVITSPRLQAHGAGRWIMSHLFQDMGPRDMVLNATRAAYRLYASLGFVSGRTVLQSQGIATLGRATPHTGVRPLTPADHAGLRALDAVALGAGRGAILDRLLAVSSGMVIEREGRVAGYALSRAFGRGHVIGPIVAESDAEAIALAAPLIAARDGQFVRVDTREDPGAFRDFLAGAGIAPYDTVTSMHRGQVVPPAEGLRAFGLASQAIG